MSIWTYYNLNLLKNDLTISTNSFLAMPIFIIKTLQLTLSYTFKNKT